MRKAIAILAVVTVSLPGCFVSGSPMEPENWCGVDSVYVDAATDTLNLALDLNSECQRTLIYKWEVTGLALPDSTT